MKILTDIYPPEIKPVRDGLYLCCYVEDSGATSVRTLRLWDGVLWRYERGGMCIEQEWHWIGLAFDPESACYWFPGASDDQPA